jgi:hypothetical protein
MLIAFNISSRGGFIPAEISLKGGISVNKNKETPDPDRGRRQVYPGIAP